MGAQSMGTYSQQEFVQGLTKLQCDSLEALKKKVPSLAQELREPPKFKEIYKFIFDFSRDQGFKNVAIETVVALWQLLLVDKCNFMR